MSGVTWSALAAVAVAMIAYEPWSYGQSPWEWVPDKKRSARSASNNGSTDEDDMEGGGIWLSMLPSELDQWVALVVPWCVAYALAMTLVAGLQYAALQWVLVDVEDDENEDHEGGSALSQYSNTNNSSNSSSKNKSNERNMRSRKSLAQWAWAWARKCGRLAHASVVTALALAVVTLVAVPLVRSLDYFFFSNILSFPYLCFNAYLSSSAQFFLPLCTFMCWSITTVDSVLVCRCNCTLLCSPSSLGLEQRACGTRLLLTA